MAALIVWGATDSRAVDAAYDIQFNSIQSKKSAIFSGRYWPPAEKSPARLRGSGSVFVPQNTGTGTYYIKFKLDEPEKFQYHRAYIGLFVKDPQDPQSDGYYLRWEPYGILSFSKIIDKKRVHLNTFIDGGRDNPNRFKAGQIVELTMHVPEKGDGVWVWCNAANRSGEHTTGFKLTGDLPTKGHFGAYNAKWYSYVSVYELRYQP